MDHQRHSFMGDGSPGRIQLLMPIVDRGNVGRLECDAVECENGHIFAVVEGDDVVRHMARKGQKLSRIAFDLDRGLALKHG